MIPREIRQRDVIRALSIKGEELVNKALVLESENNILKSVIKAIKEIKYTPEICLSTWTDEMVSLNYGTHEWVSKDSIMEALKGLED